MDLSHIGFTGDPLFGQSMAAAAVDDDLAN